MKHRTTLLALLLTPTLLRAEDPVHFTRDVRPILAKYCFHCHGPDEATRKADLRLDTREGAIGEGKPFIPGKPEASEALRRLTTEKAEERMPPGGPEKAVPPEQIAILNKWVRQGATWTEHWAFRKPVRSEPPTVADPIWNKHPIDRFVYASLSKAKLKPSPEADRRTLIRRVSLDLLGIPPTLEEVKQFVDDPAPDAYEKLVDRLLQRKQYGERWARVWLDLARYADTKGYEKDLHRNIWRYRDYVIEAFNQDMPYDRFTLEQLAGDLLPNPTTEQLLATAFHRNTLTNDEGGTDDEEFRVAAVKDRVDTTMQVWMGLTMGCAKCHSHKYDPISLGDYYRFYAFFNQTEDADRSDDAPTMPLLSRTDQARIEELKGKIDRLEEAMVAPTPENLKALANWVEREQQRKPWISLKPRSVVTASGADARTQNDGSTLITGPVSPRDVYIVSAATPLNALTAIRLELLPDPHHRNGIGRGADGNVVLSGIQLTVRPKDGIAFNVPLTSAKADFAQTLFPVDHVLRNPNPARNGWALAPKVKERHVAMFLTDRVIKIPQGAELIITLDQRYEAAQPGYSIGRFRLSVTEELEPQLDRHLPLEVDALLKVPADKRTASQTGRLLRHWSSVASEAQKYREAIYKIKNEINGIEVANKTPILRELPEGRKRITRIHQRGNFLNPGPEVKPATPASFHPSADKSPLNRLGVALWLMSPDNPLTARVAVNRHWSHFFGTGIVETQEDFGTQGSLPSHPELLDWMAVEFRESGWSFKKLCRLIVTSQTYRQQSTVTPEVAKADPKNRLLARGPRFRLEAEMVRDNALAIAGLLSSKMFGPSVMPYQPDGIWRSVYSGQKWVLSAGEDRYRRGIYTYLKRSSPYPSLIALDGTAREQCSVRRITTNTPLQALVTLNDPVYVEAAQALARQVMTAQKKTVEERIALAFERATCRPARDAELELLIKLYNSRFEAFQKAPEDAKLFASDPLGPIPQGLDTAELAAMTAICNVILNLDEVLTRS